MPQLTPRQSLNKAYLKMKPLRKDVEGFAESVANYLEHFEASFSESEEHHKNDSRDYFLKPLIHDADGKQLYMNTVHKADLAIHDGGTAKSAVKVLLEYKSPSNPREMPTADKLDCKATRELLLYYLRQRITEGNLTLTKLAVTNGAEWFIWDAQDWERAFRDDKQLIKQFKNFEAGVLSGSKTETFYNEIASPVLTKALPGLAYTYLDLRELPKFPLPVCPTDSPRGRTEPSNGNPALDSVLPSGELVGRSSAGSESSLNVPPKLIAAYKLFSGTHLLKLPFANDSNSLNKEFYNELLYIMGLEQYEVNNKKLIGRAKEGNRNPASLLEATIEQLESDGMTRVANKQSFASDRETQTYEVALALVITWINRILFCKLLEGQLLGYHNGDRDYAFMAHDTIGSYDALADLWFKALAKQLKDRSQVTREDFKKIPYLNSSLFEVTTLEKEATSIKALRDDRKLPFYHHTVLKAENGKQARRTGGEETLRYLLQFLDAYEFGSEVSEGEVLDEPRGLINASVLGLIFEKINGYKEGSFYTPGFVTEYMCRETIRAAIVSRFKESQHPALKIFDSDAWSDLVSFRQNLFRTDDLRAAEKVIDTLTLCDPAVGSGHFLVSALNELLAAKSELNLLLDEEGVAINEVAVSIVNDDLDIRYSYTDDLYEYKPGVPASDRTQKTLFEQKRRLIENCLFGVDINPNSVKICRLRLWIELLKHAYYHKNGELETLPNIDINIKVGNSLVSRFDLDVDISEALKNSGFSLEQYRAAVLDYQEAATGEGKSELRELLAKIKGSFSTEIARSDPRRKKLAQARGRLMNIESALAVGDLFGQAKTAELRAEAKKQRKLVEKHSKDFNDAEEGAFYTSNQAFEWRIEFPQVLNDAGDFIGFDVVVGNPPYFVLEKPRDADENPWQSLIDYSKGVPKYKSIMEGKLNIFRLFLALSSSLLSTTSRLAMIVPIGLLADKTSRKSRKSILGEFTDISIAAFPEKDDKNKRVFEDAKVATTIILGRKDVLDNSRSSSIHFGLFLDRNAIDFEKFNCLDRTFLSKVDPDGLAIPLAEPKLLETVSKAYQVSEFTTLSQSGLFDIKRGEINQSVYRSFIGQNKTDYRLLKGVMVQPFHVTEDISQGVIEYMQDQPSNRPLSELPDVRIATQRITGLNEKRRVVSSLVTKKEYFADSTNAITLHSNVKIDNLKILLVLLNSTLYQKCFSIYSSNNNVQTNQLEKLPWPSLDQNQQESILTVFDKLTRSSFFNEDMQDAVDQVVYQIFEI